MSQKRDNTGVLFRNDPEKKKSEASPDFGGTCTIAGRDYRIAGWVKESETQKHKNGTPKKFFSLAFSIPQKKGVN